LRKKNYCIGDLFFGIILVVVAVLFMWNNVQTKMPVDASLSTAPGLLPFIFSFLVIIMGGIVIWESIREGEFRSFCQITKDKKKLLSNIKHLIIYYNKVLIITLTTTIYIVFLFGRVYYLVGTFIFIFFTLIGINRGNYLKNLFISLLGTIAMFIFLTIFGFPMP